MGLFTRRYMSRPEEAAFDLRAALAAEAPDVLRDLAADECCGCGKWMCDVRFGDGGEKYCWRCVRRLGLGPGTFTVLPGRER